MQVQAQMSPSAIDSLSNVFYTATEDTVKIAALNKLSFQYLIENTQAAMDDVLIAREMALEVDFFKGLADTHINEGAIYWSIGEYPQALSEYLRAADVFESIDDEVGLSIVYNNVGEVHKKLGNLDQALNYLTRGLNIRKKLNDKSEALLCYINIAEVHELTGDLALAEKNYNEVLSNQNIASPRLMAYTYGGLGKIASERNETSEAQGLLKRALQLWTGLNDRRGIASSYTDIGALQLQQEQYDSADYYFQLSRQQARQFNARDLEVKAILGLVMVDSLKGDYRSAMHHFKQYDQLKDSIFNIDKSQQIARMESNYQNQLLRKESEASKIQIRQQNMLILTTIVILFCVMGVAFAFYRQRAQQSRANAILAEKNDEIQSQAEQLKNLNSNLERIIEDRTISLREKNRTLADYAFTNAHLLRAPVANILGLAHIMSKIDLSEEEREILQHLEAATHNLDRITREMSTKLEKNVDED